MKHLFLSTLALLFAFLSFGQVPQAFNYQGAARTAAGAPIANSTIAIRASVLDGSASGTVVYSERNVTTTSGSGIFSIGIGNGTPLSGSFNAINWATGNKFLKIDLDAAGGTNYVTLGTTQFLSVPYAQYAASAGQSVQAVMTLTGTLTKIFDEFGTVVSDKSGFQVSLFGSNPVIGSITNNLGNFTLANVPTGTYNLLLSKQGLGTFTLGSQSFVAGGLSTIKVDVPTLYANATTIPQNLTITTGLSNIYVGSNTIFINGTISPTGTPTQPRYVNIYFSSIPSIDPNSNGILFDAIGGSVGSPIVSNSFSFEFLPSYYPQFVPGSTLYFKAYGANSIIVPNLSNVSSEVSVVVPPKFSSGNFEIRNFSVTTVSGLNPMLPKATSIVTTFDILPANSSNPRVKVCSTTLATGVDISTLTATNRINGGSCVDVYPTNGTYNGNVPTSNVVNQFQPPLAAGSTLIFKAFPVFPDGSVNTTAANQSPNTPLIVPPINIP